MYIETQVHIHSITWRQDLQQRSNMFCRHSDSYIIIESNPSDSFFVGEFVHGQFDMNIDTRICAGILIDIVIYINQSDFI
jgi:hypothetical protein